VQNQTSPLVLTFGVADPVGATGIQADLASFGAMGCHGLSVITALSISDTTGTEDLQAIDPDWVADQAAYNILLGFGPWKDFAHTTTLKEAWAINAHVTNKPDLIQKLEPYLLEKRPHMNGEGFICNDDGVPFCIVHQYDRVPEWMEYYSKKYGTNITKDTNTGTSPKYFLYKS